VHVRKSNKNAENMKMCNDYVKQQTEKTKLNYALRKDIVSLLLTFAQYVL
jgi:hypothetical protein